MAKRTKAVEPLTTIWQVSEDLWEIIRLTLEELDPSARTGRRPILASQGSAIPGKLNVTEKTVTSEHFIVNRFIGTSLYRDL